MRAFFRRWSILPFDVLIGQLVVLTGVLGFLRVGGVQQDALSLLLNPGLLAVIQVMYASAGVLQLLGIGLGKAEIEGPGLAFLLAGASIRALAVMTFVPTVGLSTVAVAFTFQLLAIIAAVVRLRTLLRGERVYRAGRQ